MIYTWHFSSPCLVNLLRRESSNCYFAAIFLSKVLRRQRVQWLRPPVAPYTLWSPHKPTWQVWITQIDVLFEMGPSHTPHLYELPLDPSWWWLQQMACCELITFFHVFLTRLCRYSKSHGGRYFLYINSKSSSERNHVDGSQSVLFLSLFFFYWT